MLVKRSKWDESLKKRRASEIQGKGIIKHEWRYPRVVVLLSESPLKNKLPVSKWGNKVYVGRFEKFNGQR